MHTNHNSVCLNNIDLIIIFDFKMDFIVYAFILIYLPKYILHSVDIYDLGNWYWYLRPVAYNIV